MKVSEKEVAKLSRLTRLGANAGQVRFTLNKLGIQYHSLTAKFTNPEKNKSSCHPLCGQLNSRL